MFTAEKDGLRRYYKLKDGVSVQRANYHEGFGNLFFEHDPVRGFEKEGMFVPVHEHSLYWADYESGYRPQTAEQLAAARERRQQKALDKECEGILFADAICTEGQLPWRR